jgi:hypothetical protein
MIKKRWIMAFVGILAVVFCFSAPIQNVASAQSWAEELHGPKGAYEAVSTKIVREGPQRAHFCEIFEEVVVERPVVVQVSYKCLGAADPSSVYNAEFETTQIKDKWGDWVLNEMYMGAIIGGKCAELP